MKIVFIITSLGMGGAERQVCDLSDQLANIGNQILIVSLTGKSVCSPSNPNIQIKQFHMKRNLYSFIKVYVLAIGLIRSYSPDVVHSHMIHANIFARLLRLATALPKLICSAHSTFEGGKLRMLAYRLTDKLADLSTNVSEEAVRSFVNQGACKSGRMIPIYNGVDTKRFYFNSAARYSKRLDLGLSDDTALFLAVGRLEVEKDFANLLRAFANLAATSLDSRLAIIGTGSLQNDLIYLAEKLGVKERVYFLGLKMDVEDWMCACDIFVLSSAWEGFGLVIAEAMACECTVVATDCGGVKEVVGKYGKLVESRNSEVLSLALKNSLFQLKLQKFKRNKFARNWIESRYGFSSVRDNWLRIYKDS